MNLCALMGNVASDPVLVHATDGKAIASFKLAINRLGDDKADIINIVAIERQADVVKKYLAVGRRVSIEGNIRFSESGDRGSIDVVAHRIQLLGGQMAYGAEQ